MNLQINHESKYQLSIEKIISNYKTGIFKAWVQWCSTSFVLGTSDILTKPPTTLKCYNKNRRLRNQSNLKQFLAFKDNNQQVP